MIRNDKKRVFWFREDSEKGGGRQSKRGRNPHGIQSEDLKRFSGKGRWVAKQFPDRLAHEREKLMGDLANSEKKLRTLLEETRKSLAMANETAVATSAAADSITQAAGAVDKLVVDAYSRFAPGSFDIVEPTERMWR